MIKFFLKKNFCDVWDNLFSLILMNLIPLAVTVASYFCIRHAAAVNAVLSYAVTALSFGILMAVLFAWGANARKLADFGAATWGLFFTSLKKCFFPGFFFGLLIFLLAVFVAVAVPFYLNLFASGNMAGILFVALIAWFVLISLCAFQWFVPLYFLQEQNTFAKCVKKSFIIFFDNAGFSFFMLLHNAVLLALTVLTFGLIPGLNGITLSNTNALRLRLYKYDYLEEHQEYMDSRDKRREIPWDELLAEDKESLGSRKLSSFLFPWK